MATIPEALTLAVRHHQAGDLQTAKNLYEEVLRTAPEHPDALHLLGVIAHQVGQNQIAVEQIRRAIASNPRATAYHCNLAAAYEELGQLDEAVASCRRALRLNPDFVDAYSNLAILHERLNRLQEAASTAARGLQFCPDHPGMNLTVAKCEQLEQLRNAYFRSVDKFIERRPGRLLLDKAPLNVVWVGCILRIFPAAKFVVSVRHPCDVCLSCFMQDFRINGAMANFFTLEDTASLYAKVMGLWQQYRRVLPHSCHVVRYEDLVEDFEAETRRLLEFLEVDWDDAVLDYATAARSRGMINTPSYHQVTEPIYQRARGRWRRYAEQLAPIMDVLRPFVEELGYQD